MTTTGLKCGTEPSAETLGF